MILIELRHLFTRYLSCRIMLLQHYFNHWWQKIIPTEPFVNALILLPSGYHNLHLLWNRGCNSQIYVQIIQYITQRNDYSINRNSRMMSLKTVSNSIHIWARYFISDNPWKRAHFYESYDVNLTYNLVYSDPHHG